MLKIQMKKGLKGVLLGVMLLGAAGASAQDVPYSQFYANPLYLNPAFAGSAVAPRVSLVYRAQWPGLVSAFTTVSASYDQYFEDLHGGVGAILLTDRQGDHGILSTNMVGAMYAFHFQVTRDIHVSAALQTSVVQNALNVSNYMRFGSQIDPERGFVYGLDGVQLPEKTSRISLDFNAGVLVSGNKWYGGFAISHLTQPNQAFYSEDRVPMKITVGALQDLTMTARLEYISPKAVESNGANQFEIKAAVAVPTDGGKLRSGYSANAELVLASVSKALTIPESAIEFSGDSTFVYVVQGEGKKKHYDRRQVQTGLSDGVNIEIKKGLTPQDKVRGPQIIAEDKGE